MIRFLLITALIGTTAASPAFAAREKSDRYQKARFEMVQHQIEGRGITEARVLDAMRTVPRHLFVPENLRARAYRDSPLPIGEGQTISQPYIVALMTASLDLQPDQRVLEIGTGSGYQAAVLAELVGQVFTIEIKESLFRKADRILQSRHPQTVRTRLGDGYYGWQQHAPFDAIMITAAVDHIPPPLIQQLKQGGRLILPLGNPFSYQNLVLVTRQKEDYTVKQITGVLFVPLTGYALSRGK